MANGATIAGKIIKVVKRPNMKILRILDPASEVLENLTQDFHTMLRRREQTQNSSVHITCFVEELPVSKFGKKSMVCCRIFLSEGIAADFWQVVPSTSATLERYPFVTIHADHIGMTKFKEKNNDYKIVAGQLKRWMKELVVIETMFDEAAGYDTALV